MKHLKKEFICPTCNAVVAGVTEQPGRLLAAYLCPYGHQAYAHTIEPPVWTFAKGFWTVAPMLVWGECLVERYVSFRTGLVVMTLLILVAAAPAAIALRRGRRAAGLPEPSKRLAMELTYSTAGGVTACIVGAVLGLWVVLDHLR
jgi:hypothetical protein